MSEQWRVGRRNPHTVYRQHGDEPSGYENDDHDESLGYFRFPADAQRAVDAVSGAALHTVQDLDAARKQGRQAAGDTRLLLADLTRRRDLNEPSSPRYDAWQGAIGVVEEHLGGGPSDIWDRVVVGDTGPTLSDEPACMALTAGFMCTRTLGHSGQHVATARHEVVAVAARAEGEAAAGELRAPEQQLEVLRRCLARMGRELLPGQTIASATVDLIRLLTNGSASRALRTVRQAHQALDERYGSESFAADSLADRIRHHVFTACDQAEGGPTPPSGRTYRQQCSETLEALRDRGYSMRESLPGAVIAALDAPAEVVSGAEAEALPVGSVVLREPSDRDRSEVDRLLGGGGPLPSGCFPLTRTVEGWREHYNDKRPDELAATWRFRVLFRADPQAPSRPLAVGDRVKADELTRVPAGTLLAGDDGTRGLVVETSDPAAGRDVEWADVRGDLNRWPATVLDLPTGGATAP